MNCIIPFTKDIKFNTNIAEVLSISLEHDYTVNESELLGNFTVTGEYKTHEVSVNREKFEHVLPFSVSLTKTIDTSSVDFDVEDFTYEIIDTNNLRVNIEYSVKAIELEKEREEIFEKPEEEPIEELEELIEEIKEDRKEDVREKLVEFEEKLDDKEDREDIVSEEEKNVILGAVDTEDETFVTYHVHMIKENETIETICTTYKTNANILETYNDLNNLVAGDKVIIPEIDE